MLPNKDHREDHLDREAHRQAQQGVDHLGGLDLEQARHLLRV